MLPHVDLMFDRRSNPAGREVTIISRRYFCEHFILVISGDFRPFWPFCDFSINFGSSFVEEEIMFSCLLNFERTFNMAIKGSSILVVLVRSLEDASSGYIFTTKTNRQAQVNRIALSTGFIADVDF